MGIQTIVVGAGSSGPNLAARLTEDPTQEVSLLEAGRGYPLSEAVPTSVLNVVDIAGDRDWGGDAYLVELPRLVTSTTRSDRC